MTNPPLQTELFAFTNQHTGASVAGITWKKNQDDKEREEGIVFLQHATSLCKEVWVDVVVELMKHLNYRMVACDARNHGDSSHDTIIDWRHIAEDHEFLFDHVLDPAHKKLRIGIGHSMGGATLAMIEIARPHYFDLLVMIEPVFPRPPREKRPNNPLALAVIKRRSNFPDKETILDNYRSKEAYKDWSENALQAYVEHGFQEETIGGKKSLVLKCPPKEEAEFYTMGPAHGAGEEVDKIQIPVLVLLGSNTALFDTISSLEAVQSIKNGTVKQLNGSHFLPMENPKEVAEAIIDFIKKHVKSKL